MEGSNFLKITDNRTGNSILTQANPMKSPSNPPRTPTTSTLRISEKFSARRETHSESTTQDTWTPSARAPRFPTSMETRESSSTEDTQSSSWLRSPASWKFHSCWSMENYPQRANLKSSRKSTLFFIQGNDSHHVAHRRARDDEVLQIRRPPHGNVDFDNRRLFDPEAIGQPCPFGRVDLQRHQHQKQADL